MAAMSGTKQPASTRRQSATTRRYPEYPRTAAVAAAEQQQQQHNNLARRRSLHGVKPRCDEHLKQQTAEDGGHHPKAIPNLEASPETHTTNFGKLSRERSNGSPMEQDLSAQH